MLKFKNLFVIAVFFGISALVSCEKIEEKSIKDEKNSIDKNTTTQNLDEYLYFIDDKIVSEKDIVENPDYFILVDVKESHEIPNGHIITTIQFTSKEKYIEYGIKNSIHLKEELDFADHMRNYAEKSGAINEYDKTGIIPDWYTEYETEYYNKTLANMNRSVQSVMITLYKDVSGGPSSVMVNTLAAMWPGWDNTVSRMYLVGIGGGVSVYDRTFYRTKLLTLTGFGGTYYLPSGANNKMSSGVRIF